MLYHFSGRTLVQFAFVTGLICRGLIMIETVAFDHSGSALTHWCNVMCVPCSHMQIIWEHLVSGPYTSLFIIGQNHLGLQCTVGRLIYQLYRKHCNISFFLLLLLLLLLLYIVYLGSLRKPILIARNLIVFIVCLYVLCYLVSKWVISSIHFVL
jgi:hypothetical protein